MCSLLLVDKNSTTRHSKVYKKKKITIIIKLKNYDTTRIQGVEYRQFSRQKKILINHLKNI